MNANKNSTAAAAAHAADFDKRIMAAIRGREMDQLEKVRRYYGNRSGPRQDAGFSHAIMHVR
jgi:hypothetical protein